MSVNVFNKTSGNLVNVGGGSGSFLEIVDKTQAEYDALTDAEKHDTTKLYNITDSDEVDMSKYAKKTELDAYSKKELGESTFFTVHSDSTSNITQNRCYITKIMDKVYTINGFIQVGTDIPKGQSIFTPPEILRSYSSILLVSPTSNNESNALLYTESAGFTSPNKAVSAGYYYLSGIVIAK